MHNPNKCHRVFVALSPAIFTLCVSLLVAWSLIAVSLSSSDSTTAIVCLHPSSRSGISIFLLGSSSWTGIIKEWGASNLPRYIDLNIKMYISYQKHQHKPMTIFQLTTTTCIICSHIFNRVGNINVLCAIRAKNCCSAIILVSILSPTLPCIVDMIIVDITLVYYLE